ncbi:MAG: phage tail protein [Bacteroidota bacterium]
MPDFIHQTVGFHFAVTFLGLGLNGLDTRFQSVGGLEVQMDTESLKEGGENRFEHALPTRRKYSTLTLKRGLVHPLLFSSLTKWCKDAFEQGVVKPTDLNVLLLNDLHLPIMNWSVIHAWPKSWKFGELNAEKGEVLIETMELHYNRFEFTGP